MQLLPTGDNIEVAITLLKFIGENVQYTSWKTVLFRTINSAIIIFTGIFISASFQDANGSTIVNTLESLTTVVHVQFKYILLIYYKNDIKQILDERLKRFWEYRHFNKHMVAQIENMHTTIYVVQLTIIFVWLFCLELYFLKPFINERFVYLLETKIFINSLSLETVVLMCQYYFPCTVISIVFAFDAIYLSLCIDIMVQVKLLKCKLKRISSKSTNADAINEMVVCVKHHLFLLTIFARMRRIYSIMLLFHYFISLVTACTDLYESFIGEADLPNQIMKFLSVSIVLLQFAFYALPAELISSEFTDISNAMYNSKWYTSNYTIQKMILFIMLTSQREVYFTGAGLLNINIDAFGSVIRKTLSFYAIIKKLLHK